MYHQFLTVALAICIFGLLFTILLTAIIIKADGLAKLNLLLLNMALTSIMHCACFIALWVKGMVRDSVQDNTDYERILFIVNSGLYVELMFTVSLLAIERFIAVFKPFQYRLLVTRTRIKATLAISWFIVIAIRVIYLVTRVNLTLQVRFDIATNTLGLAMQPIVLISIFIRTRLANQKLRRTAIDSTGRLIMTQLVLVGVICSLEVAMDMVYIHYDMNLPSKDKSSLAYVTNIIWITNVVAIPAIHIGLKPSCLEYLKSIICKKAKRNSIVQEEVEQSVVSVRRRDEQ